MKPLLSALIIPDTKPAVHDMGSLLMFFDSLSYYLPTESDSADFSAHPLFKESCTGYAPAPLGEDLKRFNRLLKEMESSRSDDLARLFSSAQIPVSTGEVRDGTETSTGGVFAALHMDNSKIAHIQHKERLWQARLILKLAELLDRREREVREGLARIATAERNLITILEGDSETDPAEPDDVPALQQLTQPNGAPEYPDVYETGGSGMLAKLRLKAWTELFLADTNPDRPTILVAAHSQYGDSILDGYEGIRHKSPEKLFSVTVPVMPGPGTADFSEEQYLEGRNVLRQTAHNHLVSLGIYLREAACADPGSGLASENVKAWEEAVKTGFPALKTVQRKLDFYCLPGISPESLLQRLFHLTPASFDEHSPEKTLLAVLLA